MIADQFFSVIDDVAFQIHSDGFGSVLIGGLNDSAVNIVSGEMVLMNDGIVEQRVEIPLLALGRVIAIVKDVADDGDLGGVGAVTTARNAAGSACDGVGGP